MTLPDAGQLTVIVGALMGITTNLIIQILSYLREGRAHRWAKEQANFDRAERLRVAEELKGHTAEAAQVLAGKIDENTAVNVAAIEAGEKAYTEANNLSLKIQQQGLQLREPSRKTDHDDA